MSPPPPQLPFAAKHCYYATSDVGAGYSIESTCPTGTQLHTREQCEEAARDITDLTGALEGTIRPLNSNAYNDPPGVDTWVDGDYVWPRGCFVRSDKLSSVEPGKYSRMWYNSYTPLNHALTEAFAREVCRGFCPPSAPPLPPPPSPPPSPVTPTGYNADGLLTGHAMAIRGGNSNNDQECLPVDTIEYATRDTAIRCCPQASLASLLTGGATVIEAGMRAVCALGLTVVPAGELRIITPEGGNGKRVGAVAAAHECATHGLRLCTIDEMIIDGVNGGGGTGCGHDSRFIWTSSGCTLSPSPPPPTPPPP